MALTTGAILHFCSGNIQHINKVFLLNSKSASYCLRVSCIVHHHTLKVKSDEGVQKSPTLSSGPLTVLQEKTENGELMHDDYQHRVMDSLQQLYGNIQGYKPFVHGLFSKFFKKASKAPKGLYIYGAVGGGKTMLMDLFYSCCEVHCFNLAVVSSAIF
jgi:predicted ATPase